jgi:serine/threonine protein kinase
MWQFLLHEPRCLLSLLLPKILADQVIECIGQPTRRHYSTKYNDIWALGVILMNLVTGRNPWRNATPDDACFAAYLNDNDFFRQVLPISEGVNDVLKGIFILNPLRRVSLAELRRKIRALDTFFDHENDLSADAHEVASKIPSKSVSINAILSNGEDRRFSIGSLIESVDPEPQSAILGPDVDRRVHSETLVHGQPDTARVSSASDTSFLVIPSSASSGSSGPESKGPITPATHAVDVDPPVDIPDISGQVLGYPAVISDVETVGDLRGVVNVMKPRKPVDIIRSAIQRMKILSKAGLLS